MPEFKSFGEFADFLQRVSRRVPTVEREILTTVGSRVQEAAKIKLGTYQPAAGPFAAWPNLAASTLAAKSRQAATAGRGDSPEYVTGKHIFDTIHTIVAASCVDVGSDDPVADYQERGTPRLPPRSFLGAALFEETAAINSYVSTRYMKLLMTGV